MDLNIGDHEKPSHSVKRTYAPRIYNYRGGGGGAYHRRKYYHHNQQKNQETLSRKVAKTNKQEENDKEDQCIDNKSSETVVYDINVENL